MVISRIQEVKDASVMTKIIPLNAWSFNDETVDDFKQRKSTTCKGPTTNWKNQRQRRYGMQQQWQSRWFLGTRFSLRLALVGGRFKKFPSPLSSPTPKQRQLKRTPKGELGGSLLWGEQFWCITVYNKNIILQTSTRARDLFL